MLKLLLLFIGVTLCYGKSCIISAGKVVLKTSCLDFNETCQKYEISSDDKKIHVSGELICQSDDCQVYSVNINMNKKKNKKKCNKHIGGIGICNDSKCTRIDINREEYTLSLLCTDWKDNICKEMKIVYIGLNQDQTMLYALIMFVAIFFLCVSCKICRSCDCPREELYEEKTNNDMNTERLLIKVDKMTSKEKPDYNCSICLEKMDKTLKNIKLDCDHHHHASCIAKWISHGKDSCPLCKTTIS